MPDYIVTYTSMPIEADDENHAIDKAGDSKGGGNWEAEEVDLNPPAENTLERAIWRANKLIALGADEGEPEETQLADVLADLMHWANANHVDYADAHNHAVRAREAELAEWGVVKVLIENTYVNGHSSEYEVFVSPWKGGVPDEEWWDEVVLPHTGDGTGEHVEALYEATIIEIIGSTDTTMCGVTYGWQG